MEGVQLENYNYIHQHFSLDLLPAQTETRLTLRMSTPVFHTCDIPATYTILKKMLPTIFSSQCFNDNKYSFTKEVKNTEIGHLFEHIMLEYLCIEKVNNGFTQAVFNGITDWNWLEEPRGTFHITINVGWEEKEVILSALAKTVELMNIILANVSTSYLGYN